jgi:hypothetical protein
VFHGSIAYRIALTEVLLSPGGERLTPETAHFCAELLMMTPNQHRGKLDKQALQYTDATPHVVLNQLNELGTTTRRERDRMQRDLMNLKLRNSVVVAVVTAVLGAVLVKAPDIFQWCANYFGK